MKEPTRILRANPTATWEHDWRWRGRGDVHGHRALTVKAHVDSSNEPANDLPNEIVIEHTHGERRSRESIRMSREAAQELVEMLTAALSWDGE